MPRGIKIGMIMVGIVVVLPIVTIVALFVGMSQYKPSLTVRQEIGLANHGSLIIDGKERSRSEHGFSQHAGSVRRDRLRSMVWGCVRRS